MMNLGLKFDLQPIAVITEANEISGIAKSYVLLLKIKLQISNVEAIFLQCLDW